MKKIIIVLSFVAVLNTYSALAFADGQDDGGYRHPQLLSHYYQSNDRYYPPPYGQYYGHQPQRNYYNRPYQSYYYYYQPQHQNRGYDHQAIRHGFLGRCSQQRYRH